MLQTSQEIRVCMDIGSSSHYVVIGLSTGEKITGFTVKHTHEGIQAFFKKIETVQDQYKLPVVVAMEGYNGYARPIDTMVLDKGYNLYNVNNLKLARFKEIFPAPAKTDEIDAWKIFEMFMLKDTLPLAKDALQAIVKAPQVNEKLKRITRRRKDIVIEKVQITNRLHTDLESICPGIIFGFLTF
jgi:transposase